MYWYLMITKKDKTNLEKKVKIVPKKSRAKDNWGVGM